MEKFPSSHLGSCFSKKNPGHWRIAMSNIKKRGSVTGKKLSPSKTHTWWNSQQNKTLLSIKLTYFHLVKKKKKKAIITPPNEQGLLHQGLRKGRLGTCLRSKQECSGESHEFSSWSAWTLQGLCCMKMLSRQPSSGCVLGVRKGCRPSTFS